MKYFVFSDCHGDYTALINGLGEAGYNPNDPNHTLLGLGDYFGRAQINESDSRFIFNYFRSPIHANAPILLKGNHELILENMIMRKYPTYTDIYNGEHNTIASIAQVEFEKTLYDPSIFLLDSIKEFDNWLRSLPYYLETDNYYFTHAWLPDNYNTATEEEWHEWIWANTYNEAEYFRTKSFRFPKTCFLGHWRAADFNPTHEDGNYYDETVNIHFMDCCTVLSNKVDVVVVEDSDDE